MFYFKRGQERRTGELPFFLMRPIVIAICSELNCRLLLEEKKGRDFFLSSVALTPSWRLCVTEGIWLGQRLRGI